MIGCQNYLILMLHGHHKWIYIASSWFFTLSLYRWIWRTKLKVFDRCTSCNWMYFWRRHDGVCSNLTEIERHRIDQRVVEVFCRKSDDVISGKHSWTKSACLIEHLNAHCVTRWFQHCMQLVCYMTYSATMLLYVIFLASAISEICNNNNYAFMVSNTSPPFYWTFPLSSEGKFNLGPCPKRDFSYKFNEITKVRMDRYVQD